MSRMTPTMRELWARRLTPEQERRLEKMRDATLEQQRAVAKLLREHIARALTPKATR